MRLVYIQGETLPDEADIYIKKTLLDLACVSEIISNTPGLETRGAVAK